jgi:hypothetical protein
MSHICPKRWTGRMARVRGVSAASRAAASRRNVSGSMSTKRARAPTRAMAVMVAMKVNGVVTTSSPGPTPRAVRVARRASVPEETATAWGRPAELATSFSSAAISGPRMNCWEARTRSIAARTCGSMERNRAARSRRAGEARGQGATGLDL